MQQLFSTRNYSIRDFEQWEERNELTLAPKFQRRNVWSEKARSYLIDTIVRGKPIPKIYMRQDTNPQSRKTTREVVDGQQRLHTVLLFLKDGLKLRRTHNLTHGGSFFSGLDEDVQRDILKYEFVVDLLQDMPDNEVYDVFARINTYSEKLKDQEKRNAKYFGEFKSSVYSLSTEFVTFLETSKVFSPKKIIRMAEAEFISELLLAIEEGVRERKKEILDSAYERYDDKFPNRERHEKRFRETMDAIKGIIGAQLPTLVKLHAERFFYALFLAVYHLKFELPKLTAPRATLKHADYPKLGAALEQIDLTIRRLDAEKGDTAKVKEWSAEDKKLFDAYVERWVHASRRTALIQYFCRRLVKVAKG